MAGYDRPVQWDVYASTSRVYVFMDGKPSGCAVLPAGRMPAGPVTVAYRAVIYHCGIDETVTPGGHGAQVRARLQPLPQRSAHGRLRHRALGGAAGLGRDGPPVRDEVVWRLVSASRCWPRCWRAASPAAAARRARLRAPRDTAARALAARRPTIPPPSSRPRHARRWRRCATTPAPPPADPSNRVADDRGRARVRAAAVLRRWVLGAPARGRQRRLQRDAGHARRGGPRELRRAATFPRPASSTRAAPTRRSRWARSGRCGARRRCWRSRSRRFTTGTGGATPSGTRPWASWRATASSTPGASSSPSESSRRIGPSTRRSSARCRLSTTRRAFRRWRPRPPAASRWPPAAARRSPAAACPATAPTTTA